MPLIDQDKIVEAVRTLVEAAHPERVILFGSYARGDARDDSDLDLLVIEREVPDKAKEMVRLRRALRPLRIPVDVLVASVAEVEDIGHLPGTPLYWALREARALHG
jgi:predicted nucleotidyltransferase